MESGLLLHYVHMSTQKLYAICTIHKCTLLKVHIDKTANATFDGAQVVYESGFVYSITGRKQTGSPRTLVPRRRKKSEFGQYNVTKTERGDTKRTDGCLLICLARCIFAFHEMNYKTCAPIAAWKCYITPL